MKRFFSVLTFLCCLFFSVIIPVALPGITYAGNCPNYTKLPLYVTPKQGNRSQDFQVTIYFSHLTNAQRHDYDQTTDYVLDAVDSKGDPVYTSPIDIQTPFPAEDTTYHLSGAFIDQATDAQIIVSPGFTLDTSCNLSQVASGDTNIIHITTDEKAGTRIPAGGGCDPQLQTKDNTLDSLKCIQGAVCSPDSNGQNICKVPNLPTPTPTPPLPPCKSSIDNHGCSSINSAFSTIYTDPQRFISTILAILLSLSGGVALYMILRAGYQLMLSQGNAEKTKEAQDRIVSAIVGLLFTIMSLVILETIGVNILHIPGLTH